MANGPTKLKPSFILCGKMMKKKVLSKVATICVHLLNVCGISLKGLGIVSLVFLLFLWVWFGLVCLVSNDTGIKLRCGFFNVFLRNLKLGTSCNSLLPHFAVTWSFFRPCNKQFKLNFYSEAQHQQH